MLQSFLMPFLCGLVTSQQGHYFLWLKSKNWHKDEIPPGPLYERGRPTLSLPNDNKTFDDSVAADDPCSENGERLA